MIGERSREKPKAAMDRRDDPVAVEALFRRRYESGHLPGEIEHGVSSSSSTTRAT
ncbi:MAG: hypothetical protein M3317_04910 [Actinomycetota bacterium]|nr:hypothetical protein [Actinomycetota bacterium]